MIKFICLGKIKEKYLTEFIEDYKTRINKYHKIEIVELKDENDLIKEGKNIEAHIDPRSFVIACALEGKQMDSVEFSKTIDKAFLSSGTITFIIGSSEGLDGQIKQRADLLLSFSKMTLPHGIFRGILLEQIYRAFKINNNETYHK